MSNSLTRKRLGATLDIFDSKAVICAGYWCANTYCNTCSEISGGKGSDFANLLTTDSIPGRYHHSSWVTSDGLVLMGGWEAYNIGNIANTTEIVPTGGGQSRQGFNLKYSAG